MEKNLTMTRKWKRIEDNEEKEWQIVWVKKEEKNGRYKESKRALQTHTACSCIINLQWVSVWVASAFVSDQVGYRWHRPTVCQWDLQFLSCGPLPEHSSPPQARSEELFFSSASSCYQQTVLWLCSSLRQEKRKAHIALSQTEFFALEYDLISLPANSLRSVCYYNVIIMLL